MFVAESTGRPGFVVPGLLAAVTAELIMGASSVTIYQRRQENAAEG
jgi:CIC family chloride channel protein